MYKVKIIDENHEKDLETSLNNFLSTLNSDIIDIRFQVSVAMFSDEQIYCFTAMVVYDED